MKKNANLFFLIITILFVQDYFGQGPLTFRPEMSPKSPDAAALSKLLDMPASNFSGVANFTIPIFTINVDGTSFPIEINYNTSGIKVGQIASRVGLGWALNAGNISMSEQVVGITDKIGSRRDLPPNFDPNINDGNHQAIALEMIDETGPHTEISPDVYNYSTPNGSGRFIMDKTMGFGIPMPFNKMKLNLNEIVDEKGIKYKFERNTLYTNYNTCTTRVHLTNSTTSFLPSEVKTPSEKGISFEYRNKSIPAKYVTSLNEQQLVDSYTVPNSNPNHSLTAQYCYNYSVSFEKLLTKINFPEGTVNFYYNDDIDVNSVREDLPNEMFLKMIIVKNSAGQTIKDITLNYSYFISNDSFDFPNLSGLEEIKQGVSKRLKLVEVVDNLSQSSYKLSYYENHSLPNRLSYSQDFWGVYNGKSNETLIPTTTFMRRSGNQLRKVLFSGADRFPDFDYGKVGNLKQIKHPTGGITNITYEPDDFKSEIGFKKYAYTQELIEGYTSSNVLNDTTTFTVPPGAFDARIEFYLENGNTQVGANQFGMAKIKVYNINTPNTPIHNGTNTGVFEKTLLPGTYRMELSSGLPNDDSGPIFCFGNVTWRTEALDSEWFQTGTVRIQKIELIGDNQEKITRRYTYLNPDGESSGKNQGPDYFKAEKKYEYPGNTYGDVNSKTVMDNNQSAEASVANGKPISYDFVQEIYSSPNAEYKIETNYINDDIEKRDPSSLIYTGWPFTKLQNGLPNYQVQFNSVNDTIRKTNYEYDFDTSFNNLSTSYNPASPARISGATSLFLRSKFCVPGSSVQCNYDFVWSDEGISNFWIKNIKTTTKDYVDNQPTLITQQTSAYSTSTVNRHTFPIEQRSEVVGSGISSSQHYEYALEKGNEYLRGKNIVSVPLVTETKKTINGDTKVLSKTETVYPTSETDAKIRILNNTNNKDFPLPFEVLSKDLQTNTMEKQINYDFYDNRGNLQQYTTKSGTSVAIIWGYNQTQPIAKIEGATYEQVSTYITNIISKSNLDNTQGTTNSEQSLVNELDIFRKLPELSGFQITTYTYDPLIGVKSITPPNGIREYYIYDVANRLMEVKDINGRILKENKYNYKN